MSWDEQQAKMFTKDVMQQTKDAWKSGLLSPKMKEALIAQEVLMVIFTAGAVQKDVAVTDVRELFLAMKRLAGLDVES